MNDLINEIRYRITPPEAWDSDVPDVRVIYTLLAVPVAHQRLEERFGKGTVTILNSGQRTYL